MLFENRFLAAGPGGTFEDTFEHEYSFHIYRFPLDG